ncbi:glutathione S-transferase family protein [Holospora curviuscula]|uniref:Stringent starvation protein A n=1 Tax=Holospora curviuscula TaxID=1082868 RepID=A0A2S5RE54_9PROT|nr:glutathione S-transferase family protein [Holospora curviuscula]PPE05577.1 hypothetical protein HCUR_00223 [Holospora curviuscula]
MRTLYHSAFCPFSRKIAFGLKEKKLEFEHHWEVIGKPSSRLLSLNPWGELPVLVDQNLVCINHYVSNEYLEDAYPSPVLMGESNAYRVEVRRLISWFDKIVYQDVFWKLFYEKILKCQLHRIAPDTKVLKTGYALLQEHMEHLEQLTETHHFLAGKYFSWADIAGAAHLSCIDYIGDIHWKQFPSAKEWYCKIKSRPAFRQFLNQTLSGVAPSPCYNQLDF